MALPDSSVSTEVAYFLKLEAEFRGISPDSLRSNDLQALAFGLRTSVATDNPNASFVKQMLKTADAIDSLSELTTSDINYLVSIA